MEDREVRLWPGWLGVVGVFGLLAAIIWLTTLALKWEEPLMAFVLGVAAVTWLISLFGFIVNGPNQARVIQLFGKYVGTLKETGFFYGNPFYWRTRVSLRVRLFETGMTKTDEKKDAAGNVTQSATQRRQPIKVNDNDGTPIEIAAVVVWKVVKPASAVFQVDNYDEFVHLQADAALRNLASRYKYDAPETDTHSLRGHIEQVATQLKIDLQERMLQAGVEVQEARISYLAYAPEIAAAMLQRQQASAIIAARSKIVEGAVGMVEMALELLSKKGVVHLDEERKASMVSNLLVVLCGERGAQPVVNTGTLYS